MELGRKSGGNVAEAEEWNLDERVETTSLRNGILDHVTNVVLFSSLSLLHYATE